MSRKLVLVVVSVFWAAAGLFAVVLGSRDAVRQVATSEYTKVDALMLVSDYAARDLQKAGWRYTWVVRYRYQVNGATYESTQQAYTGDWSSRSLAEAEALLSASPQGSIQPAFVNPLDPADAVLRSGAVASDFLSPAIVFSALTFVVFVLLYAGASLRAESSPPAAAGLPIIETDERVSVSTSEVAPIEIAALVAILVVFGGTMLNGALNGQSLVVAAVGQATVLVLARFFAAWAWRWTAEWRARPGVMMIFDRCEGTLSIPSRFQRPTRLVFPCASVVDFGRRPYQMRLGVFVDVVGEAGETMRYHLRAFTIRRDAESYIAWCRAQLLACAEESGGETEAQQEKNRASEEISARADRFA